MSWILLLSEFGQVNHVRSSQMLWATHFNYASSGLMRLDQPDGIRCDSRSGT